nr:UbiA family prenyltransferase [Candidatus Njordarchaeota archaeon]
MVKVREWLKLFRAPTSPMTVLSVEVFFLLAGGSFLSLFNLGLVLWATLVHWLGAAHNSLTDTSRGFDQENPHMKKQPLVAGSLELNTVHNVINWLMIFALLLGVLIVWYSAGNQLYAVIYLLLFAVGGHAYNDGLNKSTVLSFIPYTLSFASLCAFSYYLVATSATPLFWLSLAYVILTQIFIVGWEFYLKDITLERERNLLRTLKVKVEKGKFKSSVAGRLFGYGLKIASVTVLFVTGLISITANVTGVSTLIILVLVIVFAILMIENREYDYKRDMIYIAASDLASLFLLPVVLAAVIGGIEVMSMISYAVIWFVIFNEVTWASLISSEY